MIIEVRDSSGVLRERFRLESGDCRIGRGYSNDIILDDPFVCSAHCRIERDEKGGFFLTDLESINGVFRAGSRRPEKHIPISHGTRLTVGRTELHFVNPAMEVGSARRMGFGHRGRGSAHGDMIRLLLPVLALIFVTVASYFLETEIDERSAAAAIVIGFIFVLGLCVLWAGFWALVGRTIFGHADTRRHFIIACWTLVALIIFVYAANFASFALAAPDLERASLVAGYSFALFELLRRHLAISTKLSNNARRIWSAAIPAVLSTVGLFLWSQLGSSYTSRLPAWTNLKPPAFALSAERTPKDAALDIPELLLELNE